MPCTAGMRARTSWSLMCLAGILTPASLAVVLEACGTASAVGSHPVATTEPHASRFRPSDVEPHVPDRDGLLADALMGVHEPADQSFGARLQVRNLRVPSTPAGASARFNFDGTKRGWVTSLGRSEILTTPAYAEGKVFIGGGFASHRFFAFNAFNGDLDWTMAAPDGGPTPAIIKNRRVIYNTESCTLFVADIETGEKLWSRWLGDPLMSQPAAVGNLVLSAYPRNGGHEFGAFSLASGEPVWSRRIPADVIQAPQVRGNSVFFATMDGTVTRLNWRNGNVEWSEDVSAASAVWVDGNRILLSAKVEGRTPRERPIVLNTHTGSVIRRGAPVPAPYFAGDSRDRELQAAQAGAWGNVPSGEHLGLRNVASGWAFQGATPAVVDGRSYTAIGSQLRAVDVATGEELWRREYAQGAGAQTISPPTVVGSQIIFGTVDGHLYFTDIDTGMVVRAYDVGEPIVFQPILAQGWVYVATGRGRLVGLEVGDPRLDGWHMWGGNAQHAGKVEDAGKVSEELLQDLQLPARGTLQLRGFEDVEADTPAQQAEQAEQEQEQLGGDLPLIGTRVSARVEGFVARVAVTQTFDNPHERPIEAAYLFPLPGDAAVDHMEMHVGDRVVRGRIKRKHVARRIYEQARETGRRAALLEQQRPNLFAQNVANVQPLERIEVRIEYVQALPFANGGYELNVPLTAPEEVQQSQAAVAVELTPGLPLRSIESPTHEIAVQRHGQAASVRLDEENASGDFVLRYRVGGEHPEATVLSQRVPVRPDDDGSPNGFFSLMVQPPLAQGASAPSIGRDLTIVVDRSSSMRGRPLEQTKEILAELIASLNEQDRLNVVLSGSNGDLADAPQPVNAELRRQAIEMVRAISPLGASDVTVALSRALDQAPENSGRLPIVLLVSDGYIGNESSVLRTIAEGLGRQRFYSLGLGYAVNRFMLDRVAEVGRGRSIVAELSDEAEQVVTRLRATVDAPVFTDVEIDWGDLDVRDIYPRRAPDVFAGQPLLIHGRFNRGGVSTIKVRGSINGERYERLVSVALGKGSADLSADTSAQTLVDAGRHASLWARAAVRDRMNRMYLRDNPALQEEVTQLGLRHHLVTQWTSFVAVEDQPVAAPARATVSPARSLPGDPEIRIPAPANARAVTVVLPFGDTLAAQWEPEIDRWTTRFLVPRDAEEGTYPIEVIVTLASGEQERSRLWYTVDQSAPMFDVELDGEVAAGATVRVRATQRITDADLQQVNRSRSTLTQTRAQLLQDARRVELRLGDAVFNLEVVAPGQWEATVPIPAAARGRLRAELVVVDLAANVRRQPLHWNIAGHGPERVSEVRP